MSNDKAAATWHPGSGPCPTCTGLEPLSLADLRDLIRETGEALETLIEHAAVLRHGEAEGFDLAGADGAATAAQASRVVELHAIADYLLMGWAKVRTAQRVAEELTAVQP
jgi:hypothetical protein